MPTYEYQCQACGHELEAFQSITAGPLRKCPECGKLKLKRMIGTGGRRLQKRRQNQKHPRLWRGQEKNHQEKRLTRVLVGGDRPVPC